MAMCQAYITSAGWLATTSAPLTVAALKLSLEYRKSQQF